MLAYLLDKIKSVLETMASSVMFMNVSMVPRFSPNVKCDFKRYGPHVLHRSEVLSQESLLCCGLHLDTNLRALEAPRYH